MGLLKMKMGRKHSLMPSGPLDCGCCDWRDAREFKREAAVAREAEVEIADAMDVERLGAEPALKLEA